MENTIGKNIKAIRESLGLTQKEVEDHLSLRPLTIRDFETARLKLPVSVAIKMSELYQVELGELVGACDIQEVRPNSVRNVESLFFGEGMSAMYYDPVIRAYLEGRHDLFYRSSIFNILTADLSEKDRKETITQLIKLLVGLILVDSKVNEKELSFVRSLLTKFGLQKKYEEVINEDFSSLEVKFSNKRIFKIEMRHFMIWVLFFFAHNDDKLSYSEVQYIERCAESLKMNKLNFLEIKEKFVAQGDSI